MDWKASYSGDVMHTAVSSCDEVLTFTAVAWNEAAHGDRCGGAQFQYSDQLSPLTITASDPDSYPVTIGATGLPSASGFD